VNLLADNKVMQDRRILILVCVSLVLHLSSYLSINIISYLQNRSNSSKNEIIEVSFVEAAPANAVKNPAQQIVETNPNQANNRVDETAKFLSAKNNTVEHETKAKNADQFKNVKPQKQMAPQVHQKTESESAPEEKLTEHSETKSKLFDTGFDVYSALNKNKNVKKQMAKEKRSVASTGEESGTNDHIKDVDESLMTQLNTREYLYYGYYSRIKNQLNQWWQPKVREKVTKLVSQGRKIASEENKTTKLIIILNKTGLLVKVQVLSESGVRDLDEAAIEAFRQAAPFPNPPNGMIEPDGTIRIRWDFVVES
jgi:TonB family protein